LWSALTDGPLFKLTLDLVMLMGRATLVELPPHLVVTVATFHKFHHIFFTKGADEPLVAMRTYM
jgi:hypothetical protein